MKARHKVLLVLGSAIFALVCCEAALRLFLRNPAPHPEPDGSNLPVGLALDEMLRYLRPSYPPPISPQWFLEDPPPLPHRMRVSDSMLTRYRDFQKRGIYPSQAEYVWNRLFVTRTRCNSASVVNFTVYPNTVLAFDPPSGTIHPFYRFPADAALPSGLVTNAYGFRGPSIEARKPPKTIRIAFAGASTTVNQHDFAFSYPERVVYWLNRFSSASHYDVRFQVINAGREGINSEDIAAIVRDEVLPLDPDIVVYYEGANQFPSAALMTDPRIPSRKEPPVGILRGTLKHFRLGQLIDSVALSPTNRWGEPRKPGYRLVWPSGVDEKNPDINNANLPLQLPTILRDLDTIRTSLEPAGGQLVVCSFEWLANEHLALSRLAHRNIYEQLNTVLWPLRYSDIRRLADFQNEVIRRYALRHKLPFLDVAGRLPQDPDLFVDAIHMTELGERLKAWVVFEQLAPLLAREIESGGLPRNPAPRPPPMPSFRDSEMTVRCGAPPPDMTVRVDTALRLDGIELAYDRASVKLGNPVKITTSGEQGSFAASIPIDMPSNLAGPQMVYLRARVTRGRIGMGVLDSKTHDFQLERTVDPSETMADIYVPVLAPETAGSFIIRNAASDGTHSQIEVADATLMATSAPVPDAVEQTIALDRAEIADRKAALRRERAGLMVTTGPQQWAYAAAVPLRLDNRQMEKVWLRVRVFEGQVGLGILTRDRKAFVVERTIGPTAEATEITLPVSANQAAGDLIIRNRAPGNLRSRVLVEGIEVHRPQ